MRHRAGRPYILEAARGVADRLVVLSNQDITSDLTVCWQSESTDGLLEMLEAAGGIASQEDLTEPKAPYPISKVCSDKAGVNPPGELYVLLVGQHGEDAVNMGGATLSQVVVLHIVTFGELGKLYQSALTLRHKTPGAVVIAAPGGEGHAGSYVSAWHEALVFRPEGWTAYLDDRMVLFPGRRQCLAPIYVPGERNADMHLVNYSAFHWDR